MYNIVNYKKYKVYCDFFDFQVSIQEDGFEYLPLIITLQNFNYSLLHNNWDLKKFTKMVFSNPLYYQRKMHGVVLWISLYIAKIISWILKLFYYVYYIIILP